MSQRAAIEMLGAQAQATEAVPLEPRLVAVTAAPSVTEFGLELSPPAAVWSNESRQRRLLVTADAMAVSVALLTVLSRFGLGVGVSVALVAIPLNVLVFKVAGLYNNEEMRLGHSTLDEAPALLQLTGLFALVVAIMRPVFVAHSFGSGQIAILWVASFAALVSGRVVARWLARRVVPPERCLVVGDVRDAERIRQRVAAGRTRTDIVACLTSDELGRLTGPEDLCDLVHDLGVHRIIIAPLTTGVDGVEQLVRMAKAIGVRVSVLPRILEVVGAGVAFDEVEGMSILGVPHFGLGRSSQVLKRALDLSATTVATLLLSPVLIAIALAIRADSKGSIFFRQIRVGCDGRRFSILKFRSMVTDAEEQKEELRSLSVAGTGLFKVRDDPRVTRVGRLLRSSSLDELPQLFNVLRGEMSLVGPRPLVADEDAQVIGLDRGRLRVKPGMTGPWQLLGTRVPLQEMVEIDYLYASNWSLWLDFKILLRTVQHVARRGNL